MLTKHDASRIVKPVKNQSKIYPKMKRRWGWLLASIFHGCLMVFEGKLEASWRQVGIKNRSKDYPKRHPKKRSEKKVSWRFLDAILDSKSVARASQNLTKKWRPVGCRLHEPSWPILAVSGSVLGPQNWRLRRFLGTFLGRLGEFWTRFWRPWTPQGFPKIYKK